MKKHKLTPTSDSLSTFIGNGTVSSATTDERVTFSNVSVRSEYACFTIRARETILLLANNTL